MTTGVGMAELLKVLKRRVPEMVGCLQRFVESESPSLEKEAADRCCGVIAQEWRVHGAAVERVAQKHRGDHLRIVWAPEQGRATGQLLVLGHYDTVYARGTLRTMPFRVKGSKVYGPGVFDMKAGIVQALFAYDVLRDVKAAMRKRVVFLWTS
jgi:glutamate carboxypeptidase